MGDASGCGPVWLGAPRFAEVLRTEPGPLLADRDVPGSGGGGSQVPAEQVRLLIYIDQLEEIFTLPSVAAQSAALLDVVAALSALPSVWVVATLRSDFMHRLESHPEIMALLRRSPPYTLLAPRGDELLDMIREPAAVTLPSASGASAGVPVYNYVVTIDDALMGITHVIRGDDHISNTPKQVAIYEAFGWPVPEFAHLSTILGPDRERLSKRHGAASISAFRRMGYLPEALANYLGLLGWGAEDGKTETFTLAELTKIFTIERVTPSPAVFDFDKLNWLNRHYIKLADPERIAKLAERQFLLQRPDIFPLWTTTEFYSAEAMAVLKSLDPPIELNFPSIELINQRKAWFDRLLALFLPAVDHLDELPAKTSPIFLFDPGAAQRDPENADLSGRRISPHCAGRACQARRRKQRLCNRGGLQRLAERDPGRNGHQGQGAL